MSVEIPLFPLGVVLFPHMPLPLRIFEERYKEMMRDCERDGVTFGVVAIREGVEAFGPAVPHDVGTLAQLRSVERLSDGGYTLLVVGASRFRVTALSRQRPYLMGRVEYLSDRSDESGPTQALAAHVRDAFTVYAERLRGPAGSAPQPLDLPDDPELLSYLVAASLQVELARRQALLEMDATDERLRGCLDLLRREAALLDRMLGGRDRVAHVSLN